MHVQAIIRAIGPSYGGFSSLLDLALSFGGLTDYIIRKMLPDRIKPQLGDQGFQQQ